MSNAVAKIEPTKGSLINRMAGRFGVDEGKLMSTLKATAFKQSDGKEPSNEQMMSLMVVADQHGLNPFTREIFAFAQNGGIVPVVGVDGWSRIINSHPQFDGMDFEQDAESCTCIVYRKDRAHPIRVTEYMSECRRGTTPWKSHPRRMLRHKAMIQCARLAFSFAGIFDPDEAEAIAEHEVYETREPELLPEMTDEQFNESAAKWSPALISGKNQPEEIKNIISTKYTLTPSQEEQIFSIARTQQDNIIEGETHADS